MRPARRTAIHPRRRAQRRRRRAARTVASHRQTADPASCRDLVRARRDHAAALRPERASPRPRRRGRDAPPRPVLAHRNRRALTARYGRGKHPAARRTASTPPGSTPSTKMFNPTATSTVERPSADLRRPRGREAFSAHPPAPVDDTPTRITTSATTSYGPVPEAQTARGPVRPGELDAGRPVGPLRADSRAARRAQPAAPCAARLRAGVAAAGLGRRLADPAEPRPRATDGTLQARVRNSTRIEGTDAA